MTNHRDALEAHLDELPMMALDLPDALILVGDAFDINPTMLVKVLMGDDCIPDPSALDDLRTAHGERDVNLMVEMIYAAIDSSTYLPFLLDALETIDAITALDD